MRLAQCIHANMEGILAKWEEFAQTLYPATTHMTPRMLRDHAQQILEAVMKDLGTPQSDVQQAEKSKGRAPELLQARETAAQTHAVLRANSGIDINQLAAEYRALRASVMRLWQQECGGGPDEVQDIIRFNEAIDQALAESIGYFHTQVERARNLLLGMLGHDMRNPLNAILLTSQSLVEMNLGEEVSESAGVLIRSGASMKALLEDLVDFNRLNLGLGINIVAEEVNLGSLFADEVNQHQAANPTRRVILTVEGEVRGRWDGRRLQQVLRNLVSNACTYGLKDEPVHVALHGSATGVFFEVKNRGAEIDPTTAAQLFNPLQRGDLDSRRAYKEGLGLGLYIVREIVKAHGGDVDFRSESGETVFSVRLPRRAGTERSVEE